MSYTMADFKRDFFRERFARLTPAEQRDVLASLSPEQRLAGLSEDQIRHYLELRTATRSTKKREPRKKD